MNDIKTRKTASWQQRSFFGKKHPYIEKNKKLKRSGSYRQKYFENNKGLSFAGINELYICPYCGKIMKNKSKITVDHIVSVRAIQRNKKLREKYDRIPDGVNCISNLTACCRRCNSRKGAKTGGLWIFLGKNGHKFMPGVRVVIIITILYGAFHALIFFRDLITPLLAGL